MKYLLIILSLYLSTFSIHAQTFGDGSDGDCVYNSGGIIAESASELNCTSLSVTAGTTVNLNSATSVFIRVLGDVDIQGTIDASADGTAAGPGGTNGGTCVGLPCNGSSGVGSTGGEGTGGIQGQELNTFGDTGGGGGAGGQYVACVDNTTCDGSNGSGPGTVGTGDVSSSGYGSESSFFSSFQGGVGGGAGGSGQTIGMGAHLAGADGGHGGGAVAIFAKGNVSITGDILADGEDGNISGGRGGAGGAGSGGAIFLLSQTNIDLSLADLSVASGSGGVEGSQGGNGGAGTNGRIRIDTPTGAYSGAPNSITVSPYQTIAIVPEDMFESDIQIGCAQREFIAYEGHKFLGTLCVTFIGILLLYNRKRFI